MLWLGFFHGHVNASHVKAWIDTIVNQGLEKLILKLEGVNIQDEYDWAPGSLFISQTLFIIDLEGGSFLRIPSSVWLLSLKILHLREIMFLDPGCMTILINGCSLLEKIIVFMHRC
ncbi:hypothetical protein Dimus_028586 [Dionaea muscipula]